MGIVEIEKISSESQHIWVNRSNKVASAIVKVFIIDDHGHKVAYIPALELTGYGKSDKSALDMLKEAVGDYFHNLIALSPKKIQSELKKYGWTKGLFTKKYENSAFIDKKGILQNLELPDTTKIEESLMSLSA